LHAQGYESTIQPDNSISDINAGLSGAFYGALDGGIGEHFAYDTTTLAILAQLEDMALTIEDRANEGLRRIGRLDTM
jgi:hypothetical protein